MGLVKGHYFRNAYTELTSYSLEITKKSKISKINKIYKKSNDKYKKGNDILIKAFQLFEMLMDNVDKPITPMELTDEVLNTQSYDKVNGYKTPEYN